MVLNAKYSVFEKIHYFLLWYKDTVFLIKKRFFLQTKDILDEYRANYHF